MELVRSILFYSHVLIGGGQGGGHTPWINSTVLRTNAKKKHGHAALKWQGLSEHLPCCLPPSTWYRRWSGRFLGSIFSALLLLAPIEFFITHRGLQNTCSCCPIHVCTLSLCPWLTRLWVPPVCFHPMSHNFSCTQLLLCNGCGFECAFKTRSQRGRPLSRDIFFGTFTFECTLLVLTAGSSIDEVKAR